VGAGGEVGKGEKKSKLYVSRRKSFQVSPVVQFRLALGSGYSNLVPPKKNPFSNENAQTKGEEENSIPSWAFEEEI